MFDISSRKPFSLKSGGWGACELAVRYNGDLSDETVGRGEIDDLTFGSTGTRTLT